MFSLPALVLLVAEAHFFSKSSPLTHFTSSVFQLAFKRGLPVYSSEDGVVDDQNHTVTDSVINWDGFQKLTIR